VTPPKIFDVLVVGELNADVVVTGPDVSPVFGEAEKLVEGAEIVLGASGAIFACGAARLGLTVAYVGRIGDDMVGRFVCAALSDAGVDISNVRTDDELPTGLSIILSSPHDRAILTAVGATAETRGSDVPDEALKSARHVHVSAYFLQTTLQPDVPDLFARAHEAGATTSLDTNWDPAGEWGGGIGAALAKTDLFMPNEAEACALARTPDVQTAVDRLAAGGGVVAVKRGADGAVAVHRHEGAEAPAWPVEVLDTTGAGDSFDAGMVAGFLWQWPLSTSLALATACGALATRRQGGTGSQATVGEAVALAGIDTQTAEVRR
jgi:sugar/nucleoside kinase (ribokinase family)